MAIFNNGRRGRLTWLHLIMVEGAGQHVLYIKIMVEGDRSTCATFNNGSWGRSVSAIFNNGRRVAGQYVLYLIMVEGCQVNMCYI